MKGKLREMIQLFHFCNATSRQYLRHQVRAFINVRIKWVRDPYLDTAVEREKNLKPLISLKNVVLSQPSQSIPLSTASPLKPSLNLTITVEKFIQTYPFIFKTFTPPNKSNSLPHIKLTPRALALHHDESLILNLSHYRRDVAERLAKLLMIARVGKLPLYLIDAFKYDLGLPHDYTLTLLVEFPDYFRVCDMGYCDANGDIVLGLELVCFRDYLAISEMEKRANAEGGSGKRRIKFSMNLPKGFDLEKRVMEWMDEWQNIPYISPYENAFHLAPNGDQAEKWAVGVIHELLTLLVSKKTERDNLLRLGEFMGFERVRFKRALVHFPGIFSVSNKIRTQTVVLREAYDGNRLLEKHPLIVMRNRYVSLMNLVLRKGRPMMRSQRKEPVGPKRSKRKHDWNVLTRSDNEVE